MARDLPMVPCERHASGAEGKNQQAHRDRVEDLGSPLVRALLRLDLRVFFAPRSRRLLRWRRARSCDPPVRQCLAQRVGGCARLVEEAHSFSGAHPGPSAFGVRSAADEALNGNRG